MNPFSAIYGAGISLRNRMYDRGSFRSFLLEAPVVSVGSISAGGAGKDAWPGWLRASYLSGRAQLTVFNRRGEKQKREARR